MEVILTDDVFDLGKRGEVVKVADGYGRNYLIPRRLAMPVTPGNLKMVEQQRIAMAKKEAKFREEAELLAAELNQLHFLISRKAGETGALFGSVTSKDLTDLLETQGVHLDRRKIIMEQPIKTIGNCTVPVRPHSDIEANLSVSIVPEGDTEIARVSRKSEETDRIIAELDAKVKEIAQLAGARKSEEPVAVPEETHKKKHPRREREAKEVEEKASE